MSGVVLEKKWSVHVIVLSHSDDEVFVTSTISLGPSTKRDFFVLFCFVFSVCHELCASTGAETETRKLHFWFPGRLGAGEGEDTLLTSCVHVTCQDGWRSFSGEPREGCGRGVPVDADAVAERWGADVVQWPLLGCDGGKSG